MAHETSGHQGISRRQVMAASAGAALASVVIPAVHAAGTSETIRVGLLGCGRRGRGAAQDCIRSAADLELTALGDVFQDNLNQAQGELKGALGDKYKATPDTCFAGFDAYQKMLDSNIDVILMCVPPGFRPLHLAAAVKAGKHVFMEKPVAVDPVGVRSVIASAEEAEKKGLAIVAGTQRRHQFHYIETMKRIRDGAIGRLVAAEVYWQGDYDYYTPPQRKPEWSDMEWQLRNWNYFLWLSGDHIVEQHVHNIDIAHWAFGTPPVKCMANGSRAVRTGPEFGHIYDNFSVSYEFPEGALCLSMSRQMKGTANRVSEKFHGTEGKAWAGAISGKVNWKYEGENPNPYVQEHTDLINSIRAGKPINEGRQVAISTAIAIMGRMAAYTGREVGWDWMMNASKLDTFPKTLALGPMPTPPVPVPGVTKLE